MTTLEEVRRRAEIDAQSRGYLLNSNPGFLKDLLQGLRANEERYGYPSCPCRPSAGVFELDRDIICPCDYRDPDVEEFGQCYCCLYVDREVHDSGVTSPIPERRPPEKQARSLGFEEEPQTAALEAAAPEKVRKLLYCKVCGYVVFREEPPHVCPICRAKKEFFADIEP
ncbi:MAG: ferredoxin:glutaredoxin reductase [Candidatus Bathyarchaeota archaeon]|nr:MAG: ferredoxin:glutaredoxin reductase [Candidatus Bathyarchaeota archaeon]